MQGAIRVQDDRQARRSAQRRGRKRAAWERRTLINSLCELSRARGDASCKVDGA